MSDLKESEADELEEKLLKTFEELTQIVAKLVGFIF